MQGKLLGGETKQQAAMNEVQARFRWLEPSNLRDAKGRRPDDDEYDSRTLRVPHDVFSRLSDSQKQYWEVKKQFRDVIIFFKVGKFYELYEEDAQLGHDVLDWKMTITGVGHCRQVGCPESGIEEACKKLVAAGYKVARMEQMETAALAKARRGHKACIRRSLQQIMTPATTTTSFQDDAVHLLALYEDAQPLHSRAGETVYGFAFVDAAAGHMYIGELSDNSSLAALNALLTHVSPKEVIIPRGSVSSATSRLLDATIRQGAVVSSLTPGAEFPDAADAVDALGKLGTWGHHDSWPEAMKGASRVALAALCALGAHLKRMKADSELLEHCTISPYELYNGAMRIDGPTMANLEILEGAEGTRQGSLLQRLDSCVSAGGRRLLRAWLCRPLSSVGHIERRLDAVEELMAGEEGGMFAEELRGLCDLERAVGRVRHVIAGPLPGLPLEMAKQRQARRLQVLASGAVGVKQATRVLGTMSGAEATQLIQAAKASPNEDSAAMCVLDGILHALDLRPSTTTAELRKVREISLSKEVLARETSGPSPKGSAHTEEEDQLMKEIEATDSLVAAFIEHIGVWEGMAAAISQVDVLLAFASFASTADGPTCRPSFLPSGCRPGSGSVLDVKDLWHPCTVTPTPGACVVPNDLKLGSSSDTGRKEKAAEADVSCSQASADSGPLGWLDCVQRVRSAAKDSDPPSHPVTARTVLLTGPNMGGKSTLLRATCAVTILAQIGCPVPASRCRLTVVDALFSRLGASDRLMSGQSTFAVECAETSSILASATKNSLVVLDELGRGTSTFDGYAIAWAVLKHLAEQVDCRMLFATHYHHLTTDFSDHPSVTCMHMAALVGGASTASSRRDSTAASMPPPWSRSDASAAAATTFLYKLSPGACPQSYGLQVAALAGIPGSVLASAQLAAGQMEGSIRATFDGAAATARLQGALKTAIAATGLSCQEFLRAQSAVRRYQGVHG